MTVELITAIAPYITALVGLLSGVYAVSRANSNQLTSTYFSRMTAAYENHWAAFAEFVYYPNDKTRNAYVVAVYNAWFIISLISRISHCFGSSKAWFKASL